uniref:CCHC-type domain-containing protein n=1 Tax=Heliothis virescens TaxID=7102 RepID=A0A2A4J968_HELVI
MTPTKPTATNDDVDENMVSPTSEVGSVQAQNVSGQITANDGWRALFEAQQNSMRLLVEALTNPPNNEVKSITLPKFQPEDADTDARAWLATVDICLSDRNIQGSKLILILSKAMKAFPNMKWEEFKEIFLSRFDTLDTCAATILKMLTCKPQEGECLAAYASRLFTLLMSRWNKLGKEEMVVSLILAHMGQIEPRLQRNIFSEEITTRCKMQRELMAFSYRKRSYQDVPKTVTSTSQDSKRPKLSSVSTKCYSCGKLGHKSYECFSRSQDKQQTTAAIERPNTAVTTRPPVTCYKCGVEGHVASRCTKTLAAGSSSAQLVAAPGAVKRVDVCGMKPVTGIITQFDNDDACPSTSHEGV